MKMEVDADFDKMFGDDIKYYKKPTAIGMGLSKVQGASTIQTVKTLTIGGKDNEQMLRLIRVLAFEWLRRSSGVDDVENPPKGLIFKHSYNRNKYYAKIKEELAEGRILTEATVSRGYEFDLDGEDSQEKGYRYEQAQRRMEKEPVIEA